MPWLPAQADTTIHSLTVQDKPILLLTAEQMAVATNTAERREQLKLAELMGYIPIKSSAWLPLV